MKENFEIFLKVVGVESTFPIEIHMRGIISKAFLREKGIINGQIDALMRDNSREGLDREKVA